ncbi:MAG: DUF2141 domain-containing protein [Parvibaculum sp.]|uniref:DUF2141 domain-containing protein n=1 Tax=Parvibaculum sp. TaxID=2024848 RepID=UPI003C75C1E6
MGTVTLTSCAMCLAVITTAFSLALPAQAGDLKVTIAGIRSDKGALMIGLYDSPEKFKKAIANSAHKGLLNDKGRLIGVTMRATPGTQGIDFPSLPPGRYAVIVFHDENGNGRLDMNLLGIPMEGYGFSNNATGFFSAPSFDASAVLISDTGAEANKSITIGLTYGVLPSLRPRFGK